VKRRGRPARSDLKLRELVEFLEQPNVGTKDAAEAFHTVERNVRKMLKDPRAKAWQALPPDVRSFRRTIECARDNVVAIAGSPIAYHHPKLELIHSELSDEEIEPLLDLPVDDVYDIALGRRERRRRESRRAARVKEQK